MTMSKLDKIRNELAENHSLGFMDGPPRASSLFSFCIGWEAAMEQVKPLVEALEKISNGCQTKRGKFIQQLYAECMRTAESALKEIEGK